MGFFRLVLELIGITPPPEKEDAERRVPEGARVVRPPPPTPSSDEANPPTKDAKSE
ncbi:MAG: hypothetical protein AAGK04_10930 [Planctomycetota bacterium]